MPFQAFTIFIPGLWPFSINQISGLATIEPNFHLLLIEAIELFPKRILEACYATCRMESLPGLDTRITFAGLQHKHYGIQAVEDLSRGSS
jgi:hypothetical protein